MTELGAVDLMSRAAALGVASGGRSSLALAGPLASTTGRTRTVVAAGLVAVELVADKLPGVPSRLEPAPLAGRVIGGAVGAVALARQRGGSVVPAAAIGAVGALAGSVLGARWREAAAHRGWTWQAALIEDACAVGLAIAACR